jgi:hypothetical protein
MGVAEELLWHHITLSYIEVVVDCTDAVDTAIDEE